MLTNENKGNDNFLIKLLIDAPRYDLSEIKYHSWISGCISHYNNDVEYIIGNLLISDSTWFKSVVFEC